MSIYKTHSIISGFIGCCSV